MFATEIGVTFYLAQEGEYTFNLPLDWNKGGFVLVDN